MQEIYRPLDTTAEVLGVMLPGGPYAELSEVRRRTRYAVLSGLETRGFIGKVEDHIGCWRPKPSKDRSLPHEIPYEDFEQENPKRQTRVLWLNEDLFSETPLQGILSVVYELRKAPPRAPDKIIGPYTSGVLESMIEEARNGTLPGRKTPPPGIVVARNGGVVTHKEGRSSSTQYSASRLAQVSLAQAEPPPNEANQHHPLCPDPQNRGWKRSQKGEWEHSQNGGWERLGCIKFYSYGATIAETQLPDYRQGL
jgi:hypothetical protein